MKNLTLLFVSVLLFAACGNPPKKAAPVAKTTDSTTTDSAHLVGMWYDEEIKTEQGEHVAYQIVTKGAKTFIQVITFKEKKLNVNDVPEIAPSAAAIKKNGNRYSSEDGSGLSYLVDKAGDLLIYEGTGFIAKCKKLL